MHGDQLDLADCIIIRLSRDLKNQALLTIHRVMKATGESLRQTRRRLAQLRQWKFIPPKPKPQIRARNAARALKREQGRQRRANAAERMGDRLNHTVTIKGYSRRQKENRHVEASP